MWKIDLSFAYSGVVIALLLCAFIGIVIYSYKTTQPKLNKVPFALLIILRWGIISVCVLLLALPNIQLHQLENTQSKAILLTDHSNSIKPYSKTLDEFSKNLSTYFSSNGIQLSTQTFNENEDQTNVIHAIEHTPELNESDYLIIATDGNQNVEAFPSKTFSTKHIYFKPIGNEKPNTTVSFRLDLPKQFHITHDKKGILNYTLSTPQPLKISLNNKIISNQILPETNTQYIIDLSESIEGQNKLDISLGPETKQYQFTVKDTRKRVLHLFTQPNLEAKFFSIVLEHSHIIRKPIHTYSFTDESVDLILLSDLHLIKSPEKVKQLQEFLEKSAAPFVLFQPAPLPFSLRSLKAFTTKEKQTNAFFVEAKLPNAFRAFFTLSNQDIIRILPQISTYPAETKENVVPFIKDISYFYYKNNVLNGILFTSTDFWKIHLQLQADVSHRLFYTQFVNYSVKQLNTSSRNAIRSTLTKPQFISNKLLTFDIFTHSSREMTYPYDVLETRVLHNGKPFTSFSSVWEKSGKYTFSLQLPSEGDVQFIHHTKLNDKIQFRKQERFSISQQSQETQERYLNTSFIEYLSSEYNGRVIHDVNDIPLDRSVKQTLRSSQFFPNKSGTLLFLLILFMGLEWWVRKRNQLL